MCMSVWHQSLLLLHSHSGSCKKGFRSAPFISLVIAVNVDKSLAACLLLQYDFYFVFYIYTPVLGSGKYTGTHTCTYTDRLLFPLLSCPSAQTCIHPTCVHMQNIYTYIRTHTYSMKAHASLSIQFVRKYVYLVYTYSLTHICLCAIDGCLFSHLPIHSSF